MTEALTAIDSALEPAHYKHLLSEGFTPKHIWLMEEQGVRSISRTEAMKMNLKIWGGNSWQSSPGLYFPFTPSFGQVRCDTPLIRKGKAVKYITPFKAATQAYVPARWEVITEGYKDAMAGSLIGEIPTGAIAGVSHTRKALPKNCGKVFLFDSDGWMNPKVAASLIRAAMHTKGKIQLVPQMDEYPKGGLCEYFKVGHTAKDYAALIKSAMTPVDFIAEWATHWADMPEATQSASLRIATHYTCLLADL